MGSILKIWKLIYLNIEQIWLFKVRIVFDIEFLDLQTVSNVIILQNAQDCKYIANGWEICSDVYDGFGIWYEQQLCIWNCRYWC